MLQKPDMGVLGVHKKPDCKRFYYGL